MGIGIAVLIAGSLAACSTASHRPAPTLSRSATPVALATPTPGPAKNASGVKITSGQEVASSDDVPKGWGYYMGSGAKTYAVNPTEPTPQPVVQDIQANVGKYADQTKGANGTAVLSAAAAAGATGRDTLIVTKMFRAKPGESPTSARWLWYVIEGSSIVNKGADAQETQAGADALAQQYAQQQGWAVGSYDVIDAAG